MPSQSEREAATVAKGQKILREVGKISRDIFDTNIAGDRGVVLTSKQIDRICSWGFFVRKVAAMAGVAARPPRFKPAPDYEIVATSLLDVLDISKEDLVLMHRALVKEKDTAGRACGVALEELSGKIHRAIRMIEVCDTGRRLFVSEERAGSSKFVCITGNSMERCAIMARRLVAEAPDLFAHLDLTEALERAGREFFASLSKMIAIPMLYRTPPRIKQMGLSIGERIRTLNPAYLAEAATAKIAASGDHRVQVLTGFCSKEEVDYFLFNNACHVHLVTRSNKTTYPFCELILLAYDGGEPLPTDTDLVINASNPGSSFRRVESFVKDFFIAPILKKEV